MSKFICALVFYILLLIPTNSSAQQDTVKVIPESNIGASAGVCFSPRTIFNSSSNNQWMDYLKPGFNAELSAELPLFHSHFGIKASFDYCGNNFDMGKFINQQETSSQYTPKYTTTSSVSYGAFNQYALLVGPFGSHSFGKLTLTVWVMAGAQYISLPNTEINIAVKDTVQTNYNSTVIYTTKLALAIDGGISLAYSLSKKISAGFSLDFLLANVNVNSTEYNEYVVQHIEYTKYSSGTAKIGVVSSGIGIKYLF